MVGESILMIGVFLFEGTLYSMVGSGVISSLRLSKKFGLFFLAGSGVILNPKSCGSRE